MNPPTEVTGRWVGGLEVQGMTLRLSLEIEAGADALKAVLTSIDQGNQAIPVSEVLLEGNHLTLRIPAVQGSYEGVVSEDAESMEGIWNQGGMSLPLRFERSNEELAAPLRPQEPSEPYPYIVEEVRFRNPEGGHILAGTLTVPEGSGPHPGAVLISGSGPQDRDEALLGHKPFLVLSDHLTRAGVAVLRFDDRGVGDSEGDFGSATTHDFATDVEAATSYLATRPEVDPARVGLVGHSEGGLIAPIVAADMGKVAYVVLLAGPGVTGAEILKAQQRLILEADGATAAQIALAQEGQERMLNVLAHAGPDEDVTPGIEEILHASFAELTPEERAAQGMGTEEAVEEAINATVRQVTSPWFRTFVTYDPRPTLERIRVPVLAINGEKDLQVPWEENLGEIEAALGRAGNSDVTIRALPDLNHLFQHAKTGSPNEYSTIEETFAPVALDLISNWIIERFGN